MSFAARSHCSCCALRQTNISHFRNATPGQVPHVDPQVLHTEDTIIELLNQRAVINRKLNTFVPACSLPPEVLTIVFEFAYWSNDDEIFATDLKESENSSSRMLFLLAKVCSVWRNIALNSSQLWTNVIISLEPSRAHEQAEMFQCWLSRSGQRPLKVQIMQDPWYAPIQSTEVIDVLVPHAHRLHALSVFLPSIWEHAVIRIANSVPLLTCLKLLVPMDGDNPSISHPRMFATAPQLREVALVHHNSMDVVLPWAQLKSLESQYDDMSQLVRTLCLCSSLRRCIADLTYLPWNTFPAPLTHTSLEELKMFGDLVRGRGPNELFQKLALPALRSFTLELTRPLAWTSSLPQFLSHAKGTLETLNLSRAVLNERDLLETLRVVPKLRKLILRNWPTTVSQNFLDLMNPNKYEGLGVIGLSDGQGGGNAMGMLGGDGRSGAHYLLPSLESLEYAGGIGFTPYALVEFLTARWRVPSVLSGLDEQKMRRASELVPSRLNLPVRLRSVKLKTPNRIQFHDLDAKVQQLQLEGMHLVFE